MIFRPALKTLIFGILATTAMAAHADEQIGAVGTTRVEPASGQGCSCETSPVNDLLKIASFQDKPKLDPGSFITEQMIMAAKPYFDFAYPNAPEEAISSNGQTIFRPNHGIVQGARVAGLTHDLVSLLVESPSSEDMKAWLNAKLSSDPQFDKKLAMIALLHRSGRTDESESIAVPQKRQDELMTAANNFEKAAAISGISFTPEEIKTYKMAIRLDGASSSDVDQSHLSRLLRCAHMFDLVRLGIRVDKKIKAEIPDLTAQQIEREFGRSQAILKATDASDGNYGAQFYKYSASPRDLANVIIQAQGSLGPN